MNENCEYSSILKLDSVLNNYFVIPSSIILDTDMTERRATVFSFFSVYRGLGCELFFSVNNIVEWMGKKPNRNSNGINNKIIKDIESLIDVDYLDVHDKLNNSSCISAAFNLSKLSQDCEYERFAVIYLDELKKILNYQNSNIKDSYINNDIVLLVFAYLRMKIYRRRNKLMPEEINFENKNNHEYDIAVRRKRAPEAYDCYYSEIANELELSARTISKAVEVLNELDLIYSESLPRIRYFDGNTEKWRTDHTIFCNTYKRESNYLLASGKDYYLTEIKNKKIKLNITLERSDC